MDQAAPISINLLDDAPAETGGEWPPSFGAHENIAAAIEQLITTQPGGKFIAIEGGWGSGKSTVVRLLSDKLEGSRDLNICVLPFDAWAHVGDYLRRTFLESLIARLTKRTPSWIDGEKWRRIADDLAKKRKTTNTTSRPSISKWAALIAFFALLMPLGGSLLVAGLQNLIAGSETRIVGDLTADIRPSSLQSPGATENLPSGTGRADVLLTGRKPATVSSEAPYWIVIGALLILTPALIAIGLWIRGRISGRGGFDEALKILINKADSETTSETTDALEPSSIEFERHFSGLMTECLSDPKRRIVLVIDNLDRIDDSDAKLIWSSMRIFLQPSEHERPHWLPRLWVIVPYDPEAVAIHWQSDENEGRSTSFLDKTFQVRFRVPPLLMSEWRAYFTFALQKAIPGIAESDCHLAYRVFALHRDDMGRGPTARDIKLFANRLAVLNVLYHGQYPLPEAALFATYQLSGKDKALPLEITTAQFPSHPDKSVKDLFGTGLADRMAAMFYCVDVETARQLLLRDPIRDALRKGDHEALTKLSKSSEGFWEVFEETIQRLRGEWTTGPATEFVQAAIAMDRSEAIKAWDTAGRALIRSAVQYAALQIQDWRPLDTVLRDGLGALFSLTSDRSVHRHVLRQLTVLPVPATTNRSPITDELASSEEWTQTLAKIFSLCEAAGTLEEYRCRFEFNPAIWQRFLTAARGNIPEKYWPNLGLSKQSADDMLGGLAGIVSAGNFNNGTADILPILLCAVERGLTLNVGALTDGIISRLSQPADLPAPEVDGLLSALPISRNGYDIGGGRLPALIATGAIHHHLNYAFDRNADRLAGLMIGLIANNNEGLPPPPNLGQSPAGHAKLLELLKQRGARPEALKRFATTATVASKLDVLLPFIRRDTGRLWLVDILVRFCADAEQAQSLDPDKVIEFWPMIKSLLSGKDEDRGAYAAYSHIVASRDDVRTVAISGDYVPQRGDVYLALLTFIPDSAAPTYRKALADKLPSLKKEAWAQELDRPGTLHEIVFKLAEVADSISLGIAYFDALHEHLQRRFSGGAEKTPVFDRIDQYAKLLSASYRMDLQRRVLRMLIKSTSKTPAFCFEAFTPSYFDKDIILERDELVTEFFEPAIAQKDARAIRWIADCLETHTQVVTGIDAPPPGLELLKGRVRDARQDPAYKEMAADLGRVALVLGLEDVSEGTMLPSA